MSKKGPETIDAERQMTRALYTAIGRFMFEFSQLEFIIRHALGAALNMNETGANVPFDIVTSPYDFVTLCNVTKAIFLRTMGWEESDRKEVEPPRICRRPQPLRGWGYGYEEEDIE